SRSSSRSATRAPRTSFRRFCAATGRRRWCRWGSRSVRPETSSSERATMFKINLLPVKAAKRREQGQRQLLIGVVVFSAALVGIIVFHGTQVAQINSLREHNTQLSKDIAKLKAEIGDYEVIKAQRDELIRQRDAISGCRPIAAVRPI